MKIIIILLIQIAIFCSKINVTEPQNKTIEQTNSTDSTTNLKINISIKKQKESDLKLIMIPPDSGFWIYENDTIHLDSLSFYL